MLRKSAFTNDALINKEDVSKVRRHYRIACHSNRILHFGWNDKKIAGSGFDTSLFVDR